MTSIRFFALAFATAMLAAPVAQSATFADLSGGGGGSQYTGPYRAGPYAAGPAGPYGAASHNGYGAAFGAGPYALAPPFPGAQSPSGGPQGVPPPPLDELAAPTMAPMPASPPPYFGPRADLPYLSLGPGAGPAGQLKRETFGQVNSMTDPFNPWGLSTPFMFVPWSTPLSGWTNAQTWNWWRERSGALPRSW